MYYHGTDDFDLDLTQTNPSSGTHDICLTSCERIAWQYAERWGEGIVFEMWEVDDLRIASTEEGLAILGYDEIDVEMMLHDPSALFSAFDQAGDAIIQAGFDAVEYLDRLPGTPEKFTCLRVYATHKLETTDRYTRTRD